MVSSKTLIVLLLALFSISQAHKHGDGSSCQHDQIEQNPGLLDIEEGFSTPQGERMLQSSFPNIRIYPFFDFLVASASADYASYIQNELIPPIVDYFQAALKVKYPVVGNLKLSSSVTSICEKSTPAILKTGVATDYFIYFDSFADNTTLIAKTAYCYLSSGTKRPIISRTLMNSNMLLASTDVLVHERNMNTFMHEMMHTMGFSGSLYGYFVDVNGTALKNHIKSVQIAGSTRFVIDVAPLSDKLRNFYGCPSLQGAIMENSGGDLTAASHFERQFFYYDTMSSGAIFGGRLTEFDLAMLEGSGWYLPDYSYTEPFFFGQGQGCSFLNGNCATSSYQFSEFCTGSNKGCTPHGNGGGYCSSDPISDGCKFYYPSENYYCENEDGADRASFPTLQAFGRGSGSKCFTGNLATKKSTTISSNTFCFTYTCVGSGVNTQLQVKVGTNTITCTAEGTSSVSGYYGTIDCPDPLTFCNTAGKKFCPKNCMGRGTCVNNQCQCKTGYGGIDCALNV